MAIPRIPSSPQSEGASSCPVGSLVDELLSHYVDWREDAIAVGDAYTRWSSGPAGERPWRFVVYMAALDQEEASANGYAVAVAKLERSLERGAAGEP